MLVIAVVATISYNISVSMQGGEESLFSSIMSFIALIFMAPFIWWTIGIHDHSSLSESSLLCSYVF